MRLLRTSGHSGITGVRMRRPMLLCWCLIWVALLTSGPTLAQTPNPGGSDGQTSLQASILGTWSGARLQCRKDESGPVRCGTPTPFRISFRADGKGTIQGEGFPPEFTYQVVSNKIKAQSPERPHRWEFFDVKVENDYVNFQTYLYPEAGKEEGENYIHFIFDLAKETAEPASSPEGP